jgi:hypothetical protein
MHSACQATVDLTALLDEGSPFEESVEFCCCLFAFDAICNPHMTLFLRCRLKAALQSLSTRNAQSIRLVDMLVDPRYAVLIETVLDDLKNELKKLQPLKVRRCRVKSGCVRAL